MRCPHCQTPIRPGAEFCVTCGMPANRMSPAFAPECRTVASSYANQSGLEQIPPKQHDRPRRSARAVLLAATGVLLVVATIATTLLILGSGPSRPAPVATASDATGTTASPSNTYMQATPPTAADTTDPSTSVTTDPAAGVDVDSELAGAVRHDQADVNTLDGSWVPQLSSMQPGTVADGFTYTKADIFADYQRSRADYPEARLLRSADWAVFASPGYYVTVAAIAYSSPDQANAWCDAHYLAPNDCYAKKLGHMAGPNTTKHRT